MPVFAAFVRRLVQGRGKDPLCVRQTHAQRHPALHGIDGQHFDPVGFGKAPDGGNRLGQGTLALGREIGTADALGKFGEVGGAAGPAPLTSWPLEMKRKNEAQVRALAPDDAFGLRWRAIDALSNAGFTQPGSRGAELPR